MFSDLLHARAQQTQYDDDDLIKARGAQMESDDDEDVSPERLREIMDELFSAPAQTKKGGYSYRDELEKQMMDDEDEFEDDEDEDDEGEDMEKGDGDKKERRSLMSQVYSMVDDMSDEELSAIINSRTMQKALAMGVINQMSTSELGELVDQMTANGEQGMSAVEGAMTKGEDMGEDMSEDEDLDEGDEG